MSRPIIRLLLCGCLIAIVGIAHAQGSPESEQAEKLRIQKPARDAVVVYSEPGFRGRSEAFSGNDRRLDNNRIGNDGPASVRVPRGCRVTLFEHYDFVGRSVQIENDVADLARTPLGRREASSLRVVCVAADTRPEPDDDPDRQLRNRRGAIVFSETGFRGRYEFFAQAEGDLGRKRIGDDAASSVRLARGCRLILFTERGFKGKAAEITGDLPLLRRTAIGPDTASSLIVDCVDRGSGVTLFSDSRFRGQRLVLNRDEARLAESPIGENRVGSVRVSPDCRATLFDQPGFRGRSLSLERDAISLVGQSVGPDATSSIRVRCKGKPTNDDELAYGSGAVLYDRSHFLGDGVQIREDTARLSRSPIGNDRASSIRVAPGCEVRLFRDSDFRGRGVLIDESIDDLDRIRGIGSNELSSLRIRCNSWLNQQR